MISMQFIRQLICLSLLVSTALAQSVSWSDAGTGDPADLQLVFDECSPDGTPNPPTVNAVRFTFRGQSEQTTMINFSLSRSVILSYRLQISNPGQIQIPAFKVKTNKGELTVPAYNTGTVNPGPETDIKARLQTDRKTVWAGEVFPLVYSLDAARRNFSNFGGGVEWDATPLLVEDWSKPEITELTRGGESRLNFIFRTRGYLDSPGKVQIKPISQLINLALGTTGFRLFQQQRIEQVSISTDPLDINVRPLPLPAPASFTGGVGQFKLESKIVPNNAAVGEPITWTLELSGTGNWSDIAGLPSRSVSQDFQVIQPQAKRTVEEGKLFDANLVEDVVLVPTKPGTYTLGSVAFSYFDPKSGKYETISTPITTVTVTAAAAPKYNVTPVEPTVVKSDAVQKIVAPEAPENPTGIPRDPIAGVDPVSSPFKSFAKLLAVVMAPFGGVLIIWLILAYRRARQTDPLRPRREARARLVYTVRQLSALSGNVSNSQLLIQWQHDAAQLFAVPHAAPAPQSLQDQKWAELWRESDHTLYGEKIDLPSDWIPRADAVLASTKISGTAIWRTLLPKNLLPFLGVMLVLLTVPSLHASATSPISELRSPNSEYNRGDYAAAEKGWRSMVEASPTDWIARHNLSLALAQQERWAEGAAHATAAFVQNPRSDAARWNLAYAYHQAGYTPTAIAPLMQSGPLADLARLTSPADWECLMVVSSVVIAIAIITLLFLAYGIGPRWSKWPALVLVFVGLFIVGGSLAGRSAYGVAAHPQAVLVWRAVTLYSIPTEADTAQQTTTLAAGAMGTIDKTFLGWVRLSFPNGQTGWVRKTEFVPLWR